jgi:hypothetical protein
VSAKPANALISPRSWSTRQLLRNDSRGGGSGELSGANIPSLLPARPGPGVGRATNTSLSLLRRMSAYHATVSRILPSLTCSVLRPKQYSTISISDDLPVFRQPVRTLSPGLSRSTRGSAIVAW